MFPVWLSHLHCVVDEKTLVIEIVSFFVPLSALIIAILLIIIWLFGILDLPESHQVVRVRTDFLY